MNRRWILAVALLTLAQPQPLHAETQTWFGFQVGIRGGDPPPPTVVLRSPPHVVFVDDVYIVDDSRCDDDMFRTTGAWWRFHHGGWFRAASWQGPWYAVDVRHVPRPILTVPSRRWKHHPRNDRWAVVTRDQGGDRGHDRDGRGRDDHDRGGRGHDRDHGKHGHGHDKHGRGNHD